jgi:Uma2 family endonuclease
MSVADTTVSDDVLYEVVDGEIREKIVGVREIQIASLLHGFLFLFLHQNKLGQAVIEMIFRIDTAKDLQRRPDVAFVSRSRWALDREVPDSSAWDVVPDLVIEVISPTNAAVGVQAKIEEYFDAGVSAVWVIYPRQQRIHIYGSPTKIQVLQLGDELDGGDLLPGFKLPLRALFKVHAE